MIETLDFIFPEMMAHPALFTHPDPKRIVVLGDHNHLILKEVLKHTNIAEVYHTESKVEQKKGINIIFEVKLVSLKANSIDIIINATDVDPQKTKHFYEILNNDGILIQQSVSPFAINPLKSLTHVMHQTGFSDLQLLSFPQPHYATGWQSIVMALKQGMFKRLREKVIFNKPFKTDYYNFDVHKAATVLPEFIRDSKLF